MARKVPDAPGGHPKALDGGDGAAATDVAAYLAGALAPVASTCHSDRNAEPPNLSRGWVGPAEL